MSETLPVVGQRCFYPMNDKNYLKDLKRKLM